jgi:L-fuculose-phosphate aldolase
MLNIAQQIIDIGLRLLDARLLTGTAGNISARCSDGESVLITPSARDYRSLTEQDLVRVHLVSAKAEGRWRPSSEWQLHAATYRTRTDVNAIIHHHGTWASMVAVARKTIPVLIDEAADIGPIPTAPYAPSGSAELAEAVARELAKGSNAVLLANHGAVAVGQDLAEALDRALQVERLAKIYVGAEVLGGAQPLDQTAIRRSQEFIHNYHADRVSLLHE